ncbi:MAG TPA: SAM-dependent chlorinase/fluorinase [Egibacteraceae bacterium]|nr:SAM-dependent chlorinase/fluorinase [Egibacteraceae bacterium]
MRPIMFLSDFGLADPFVGLCHSVIERIAPGAKVIDLTHGIAPQAIRHGAATLADCVGWLPPGVCLAVVDPGVGTARRGLIVVAGDQLLVGPDNGLLWPAAQVLGGVSGAWELRADPAASPTFHGRDVFAPASARLAAGGDPESLGIAMSTDDLTELALPAARVSAGFIEAEVLAVDRFGNLQLCATGADLKAAGFAQGQQILVTAGGGEHVASVVATFAGAPPASIVVLEDSLGRAAVAVNAGDASKRLGAAREAPVILRATASQSGAEPG